MERVGVLIDKLQQQLSQKASVGDMLITTQMLQGELLMQAEQINGADNYENKKVVVSVPNASIFATSFAVAQDQYKPISKPEPEPEPVGEPEAEPEIKLPEETPAPTPKPEPEPIPHVAEEKPWHSVFPETSNTTKPWAIDPMLDVPTLAHQEKRVYELNDVIADEKAPALNERLKEDKVELADVLVDTPIHDLKKAISINDRHRFVSELFRGDEVMYERSIKTINSFNIYPEAEYWIQRELKVKLGWDVSLPIVKAFDQLVKRRFA